MTDDLAPRMRLADGRWAKGASGNPAGRPRRDVEKKYVDALIGRVPIEDWVEMIDAQVKAGKKGDLKALEWLARYLLGDPIHVHEYLFTKQEDVTIRVIFEGNRQLTETVEGEYEMLESGEGNDEGDA